MGLKGVRTNCHVQILHEGKIHSESHGELQFTEYGFSGPVIFEVSRDACYGRGNWSCRLDFLPDMDGGIWYRMDTGEVLDKTLPVESDLMLAVKEPDKS